MASLLIAGATAGRAAALVVTVSDAEGLAAKWAAPVSATIDLSEFSNSVPAASQFRLTALNPTEIDQSAGVAAQFEPDAPDSRHGTLRWLMPPGPAGQRKFLVEAETNSPAPLMRVRRDEVSGQFELNEAGTPVLRYNYQTNEPGGLLAKITPDNLKYARARSDYLHPLYGPGGEELTRDWSVDHPHHRGIYWAWPEVDYHGERGDLHALQRVFARPTGNCQVQEGPLYALIDAENVWRWDDREPIVRERALIRAWRRQPTGRLVDLEFHFTALKDDVALARRDTDKYGGLNLRFAAVKDQEIVCHTDPAGTAVRRAWADLSGVFPGGQAAGVAVFQAPSNPDYPGDWVQYPTINWFQPTFPAAGTRYVLKQGQPLVLKFRLFIHAGKADETKLAEGWTAYAGDGIPHRLTPIPIQQVVVQDDFWSPKLKVWREVTMPDCWAKFERDGALTNFDKIREGAGGEHSGPAWYDGLIYEMIRGGADFLAAEPDAALEARLDGYIERIAAAAAKDPHGYLNTWTQLKAPAQRWGLNGGNDVEQHDVYNAGALVEAAVHYYRATGKIRLLQVATQLANHMADIMGPPPKLNIAPGHSLGEEALVKLYLLFREQPELKSRMSVPVDEPSYLKLAEFWIENRGHHEGGRSFGRFDGSYAQDHKPVLEQETIEGHAVRATLLCAGLAAAAQANGRKDYLAAARRLWNNLVRRRMYVIGGLGAVAGHEGFGPDYVLPNNGYLETCAAIGAGFFHHNMNLALADARYADELERVLYNAVLPGVSLSGNTYFYENPLEAGPKRSRWQWHGCPCCPPMFLKIMGALPGYIYARDTDAVYVNLFVGSRASLTLKGTQLTLRQATRYPWDGQVQLFVEPRRETEFTVGVRLPSWCAEPKLQVNGVAVTNSERINGYARLTRTWRRGDVIELSLPMPVERLKAHPKVVANTGRVALQRGPLVYCLEGVDNGGPVRHLVIPPEARLTAQHRADLLGGVTVIQGPALARHRVAWPDQLYLPSASLPEVTPTEFTAIPYFANANRQPGEMRVWLAETADQAEPQPSPTLASAAQPSASHCWRDDTAAALNDQVEPAASDDPKIPRFTWWDHRGTSEWAQYDFAQPATVRAIEVYWWDERRLQAHCRVPQSWRLLYQTGDVWQPVTGASPYGVDMDGFNRVTFDPVATRALRLEVQLQPEWSGGILEWRVE